MFCPQCRKPASPENRFCIYCGARLEEQLSADEWYNRGYFYYTGTEGYPQDYDKAYACFLKAADMNELESINYIGVMYLDGIGKPQNTQTAIYWFRRALTVEPTFGRANFNLGRIYYDGIGVEMNYDLPMTIFVRRSRLARWSLTMRMPAILWRIFGWKSGSNRRRACLM